MNTAREQVFPRVKLTFSRGEGYKGHFKVTFFLLIKHRYLLYLTRQVKTQYTYRERSFERNIVETFIFFLFFSSPFFSSHKRRWYLRQGKERTYVRTYLLCLARHSDERGTSLKRSVKTSSLERSVRKETVRNGRATINVDLRC